VSEADERLGGFVNIYDDGPFDVALFVYSQVDIYITGIPA
jgi:hypothetical protein